jgi:uncharacterized OB-fold protein
MTDGIASGHHGHSPDHEHSPAAPGTEGWFRDDAEGFALLASRCTACGSLAFPPRRTGCPDPDCDGLESEEAALSTRGTLWSYTDSRYAPPPPYPRPVEGEFTPYTLAAVELAAEAMVVLGQVAPGYATSDLRVGMKMDLIAGILETSEGIPERVWHWRPAEAVSIETVSTAFAGGAR